MLSHSIDMVLVNSAKTMGSNEGEYTLMTKSTALPVKGTKEEIAAVIWDAIIPGHTV